MPELTDHERAELKRKLAAAELAGDEDAILEARVALGRVSAAERRAAALEEQAPEQAKHTPPKGRTTRPAPAQTTAPAGE